MTRWQEPDVAYNFLYRPPANSLQSVFKYFVAAEVGIANTLHRHFWWYENVLWLEDLPARLRKPQRFKVLLAGGDDIVNVPLIQGYLRDWRPAEDGGGGKAEAGCGEGAAEVVVASGLEHAELCVNGDAMRTALRMVEALVRDGK